MDLKNPAMGPYVGRAKRYAPTILSVCVWGGRSILFPLKNIGPTHYSWSFLGEF